jgi:hypothetical protein
VGQGGWITVSELAGLLSLTDQIGHQSHRREIAVETCEVYAFAGTTVAESWVYGDTMSLFNQISERP